MGTIWVTQHGIPQKSTNNEGVGLSNKFNNDWLTRMWANAQRDGRPA